MSSLGQVQTSTVAPAVRHATYKYGGTNTLTAEDELETAFTTMIRQRVDALVVKPDPFFISGRERLVVLAAHHAIPHFACLLTSAVSSGWHEPRAWGQSSTVL